MVVEEKTFSRIERSYGCHIFVGERKIKNVDILPHSFDVGRFGNDNHAALDKPTQGNLSYAFAAFAADFAKQRICKETVASFGERPPRHDARIELFHDSLRFDLLVEHMRLYLIHGWNDLHITGQIDKMVGIEIADADGTEFTFLVSLFQLVDAVEMGYTFFDTAEAYGTADRPHDNEELLGEALRPFRDRVVIATKFGISFDRPEADGTHAVIPDSRPETVRRAVEGSLRRLHTDRIDLYYQHRIDPTIEPETVAEVMADLIREGKILHWGISEATEEYLCRAHRVCPVTAIQNRYSMMARRHETLFPVLEELGVGFVAFSPLANGLLSNRYTAETTFDPATDYRASMPQYRRESFVKNRPLFALLERLADEHRATASQISLAWMINKRPWIVPIPGTRCLCRLKENIGAADVHLSAEEVRAIDAELDTMEMSEVFGGSPIIR